MAQKWNEKWPENVNLWTTLLSEGTICFKKIYLIQVAIYSAYFYLIPKLRTVKQNYFSY